MLFASPSDSNSVIAKQFQSQKIWQQTDLRDVPITVLGRQPRLDLAKITQQGLAGVATAEHSRGTADRFSADQ